MAEEKKSNTSEKTTVCGTKDPKIEKCCFDMNILDKKLMTCCILCALISIVTVFVIMKVGINYHEEKIHSITEDYTSLDNRVKSIAETIASVSTALESLKTDLKLDKGNSSYVYTSLATMQRDIDIIKTELHIRPSVPDEAVKTLPAAKIDFIQTLENMVNDGAPFESFVASCDETIDMKKYASSGTFMKFAKQHVKSINTLEKEFISVSLNVFHTHPKESFWEKQKRVIKEKINKAITIRKQDGAAIAGEASDEELFNQAHEKVVDKKPGDALDLLVRIKLENEELSTLEAGLRKRTELNQAFEEFKKEFVSLESQAKTPIGEDPTAATTPAPIDDTTTEQTGPAVADSSGPAKANEEAVSPDRGSETETSAADRENAATEDVAQDKENSDDNLPTHDEKKNEEEAKTEPTS
ncbi:MAG: hypothetical protein LBF56_01485 [Holosporales bacterium]|jgi:hypothetical protein|nr:hypothetical protein [Holosporales bacterium]